MKLLYSISFFLLISANLKAQSWDFIEVLDSIDFENSIPHLVLDTSAANLWQIAPPQKEVLNSAYSPSHVIITDSISSYPIATATHFDIIVSEANSWEYPWAFFVRFRHKICSDSLRDGGYITYSCDMGETWRNVISEESCMDWPGHPGYEEWSEDYRNLYAEEDTLYNGEPGFSGCMDDWEQVVLDWYYHPISPNREDLGDTLLIRFNFISDSINDPYDGWMIDDIHFFAADLGGSVTEVDKARFEIYPNPAHSNIQIEMEDYVSNPRISLFDGQGKMVKQTSSSSGEQLYLDTSSIPNGLYFIQVESQNESLGMRKLLVQH